MKFKLLLSLLACGSLTVMAEGYKDGVEYFRADQPAEAAIILNRTLNDAGTDKATAYYYLGQVQLKDGNLAAASDMFNKGLQADADNAYNYIGLGALELANGNASAAAGYFKDAKKNAKKNVDMLTEIARAYFVADPVKYASEIDKALADAKKVDKNAPAPYILEGDRLASTNVGEAAGMYEMAAQFDKNLEHPEAYVKYARTYFRVNPGFAISKLNDLLQAQPNSALAQRELAEKYYENNQLTRAAEQYEKYIENPNSFPSDKQRLVGLLYFAQRNEDSHRLSEELLAADPDNFYMQRLKFYNLKALGRDAEAKTAADALFANKKAELTPQDYIQYGELLQTAGQDTLAVTMFEKAVQVSPEKTSLLKDLSAAYNSAKMYDKAADTMAAYIDMEGENANANDVLGLANRYKNLAISYMSTDTVASLAASEKALKTIDKVIGMIDPNPMVLNTKSDIIRLQSFGVVTPEVIAADQATLELLDSNPANLEQRKNIYTAIFSRLGNYYITNGDKENARIYFQRFYDIQPSEELQKFIEERLQ